MMKRPILINVSYVVEAEEGAFWNTESGYVADEVEKALSRRFPKEMRLTPLLKAEREGLLHMPMDGAGTNISRCPVCKHFMMDCTRPDSIPILRSAKRVEGVLLCSSCAWEVAYDLQKGRRMEDILKK